MIYPVRATVFASCRVSGAAHLLFDYGLIKLTHGKAKWFTHTAKEASEKFRMMDGDLPVPYDLLPLKARDHAFFAEEFRTKPSATRKGVTAARSEVIFIEVSSKKDIFLSCGGGATLDVYFDYVARHRDRFSEAVRRAVDAGCDVRVISDEELAADTEALLAPFASKPVILTGPIPWRNPDGSGIPARAAIETVLRTVAAGRPRVTYVDPGALIGCIGQDAACQNPDYYRPPFYALQARLFYQMLYPGAEDEALNALAEFYEAMLRRCFEEASVLGPGACELAPKSVAREARLYLAYCLEKTGDTDRACALYREAAGFPAGAVAEA